MLEPALELAAVEEAGQRIVAREMRESRRVLALAAHVVKDEHGADDLARPVANRRDAVIDRHRRVAAPAQDDVAVRLHYAAVAQRTGDGIGNLDPGAFIHYGKHRRHGTPRGRPRCASRSAVPPRG